MKKSFIVFSLLLFFACNNSNHAKTNNNASLNNECCELLPCICNKDKTPIEELTIKKKMNAETICLRLDSLFSTRVKGGFNGNVLIAKNGVVVYKKSFGFENYSKKDFLTEDSKFQLASISKQFTAVAILKLIQEKKLSLLNTVDQYFPSFPYKNITIKCLLSHRSGLPEYMHVFSNKIKPFSITNNNEILKWFAEDLPPMAAPVETKFEYCNSNYCVLAAILEHVTGQDFASYMRQTIFLPLGMKNTYVLTTNDPSINVHRTFGYTPKWEMHDLDFFDGVVGDKGIFTTTVDMYTWSKMLKSGCLLSQEIIKEMFQPRSFEKPGRKNYGYGFRMLDPQSDTSKLIYHNGWWKGYNTSFYMSAFYDYTIIVLGNKYNRSIYQALPIIDILVGKVEDGSIEGEDGPQ